MKTLELTRLSLPDNPSFGYGDKYRIVDNDFVIASGSISASPVPYQPKTKKPWWQVYGYIADGQYKYKCVIHYRFGKCLIIENGKAVPSVNTLHGRSILTGIFVHSGGRNSKMKTWRGSKGCFTVHPDHWDEFISNFDHNETGVLILTSKIPVSEEVWGK